MAVMPFGSDRFAFEVQTVPERPMEAAGGKHAAVAQGHAQTRLLPVMIGGGRGPCPLAVGKVPIQPGGDGKIPVVVVRGMVAREGELLTRMGWRGRGGPGRNER